MPTTCCWPGSVQGARSALAKRRHDALRRFCTKDPGALDRPRQRGTMPQPGETGSVTTAWSDLYPRVLLAPSPVIGPGGTGVLCTFPGYRLRAAAWCRLHLPPRAGYGGSCAWSCVPFPRSLVAVVPGCCAPSPVMCAVSYHRGLTLTLVFDFDFDFAWVGAVLWSCFLTSAPGCGGEVRKRSAERVGRHPARPAAVAAVFVPRILPVWAGGPLRGGCAAGVCPCVSWGAGCSRAWRWRRRGRGRGARGFPIPRVGCQRRTGCLMLMESMDRSRCTYSGWSDTAVLVSARRRSWRL